MGQICSSNPVDGYTVNILDDSRLFMVERYYMDIVAASGKSCRQMLDDNFYPTPDVGPIVVGTKKYPQVTRSTMVITDPGLDPQQADEERREQDLQPARHQGHAQQGRADHRAFGRPEPLCDPGGEDPE